MFLVAHGDAADYMFLLSTKCEKESTLCLDEACTMRTLQEGTIQMLESLVPAYPSENISYITTFLDPYQAFTSSQQILGHFFKR